MVWAVGQRLQNGKYIIEKILGQGGFGITYQARHTLLEQLIDGRAVLIDFGIAGEILQTVESSKHFGNLAFAPYEQMMGSREPTVDV